MTTNKQKTTKVIIIIVLYTIIRFLDYYSTYLVLGFDIGESDGMFIENNVLVREYGFTFANNVIFGVFWLLLYIFAFVYSELYFKLSYPENINTPLKKIKYYIFGINSFCQFAGRILNYFGFVYMRAGLITLTVVVCNNLLHYIYANPLTESSVLYQLSQSYNKFSVYLELKLGCQLGAIADTLITVLVICYFFWHYFFKKESPQIQ